MTHDWVPRPEGWMCNRCGEHGGNGPQPVTPNQECQFADGCCGGPPEEEESLEQIARRVMPEADRTARRAIR
jgi:hypothetical protein